MLWIAGRMAGDAVDVLAPGLPNKGPGVPVLKI